MNRKNVAWHTVKLFSDIASGLKPRPVMLVSDWADEYRVLPQGTAAEPGRWNTDRAPYQREIMNAVNNPEITDISIMSSAQVGKTEIVLNIVGYFIDYEPSTIMVVQPTVEMGNTFSKDRLAPMIKDTKCLSDKVKEPRTKDSDNTISHKKFPGGIISIAGANSPSSLASRPIRVVLMDEVDRYPESAGSEGDPVGLAEKRCTTFWNKKRIKVSTPTIEGVSKIKQQFLSGTQEEWSVRCPCCGKYQPYEFKRLKFSTMEMECLYCKESMSERDWKAQPHKWIPVNPEEKHHRSFHLNEMCSPWVTWDDIVKVWTKANERFKKFGLTDLLKVFVNTVLGETWEERGEGADEQDLLKRREHYNAQLPDGVVVLTAGVDTQDDRLELEVAGWGKGYESWGIIKREFRGDPSEDTVWNQLEEYLEQPFYFENGNSLNIAATCIDTGGHHTNKVYKFVRMMAKKRKSIFGIKGYSDKPGIPLIYKKTKVEIKNSTGATIDETNIFILGVDAGKEDIVDRLQKKDVGPGYCHFPDNKNLGYNEMYFKGITSEEKVTKLVKNRMRIVWVKKSGVRNEPLDLRNYAYAAVELLNPNWNLLAEKVEKGINYMQKSKSASKKKRYGAINHGIEV